MQKVMLIEDDPTMVSLLKMLFNLEGFTVTTPVNGTLEGYLSAIIEERPQLLLVDVNLHISNGLDLVRKIREEPEIFNTRILMFSGLNLKKECMEAGANGFIMKPFMPNDLISLIHSTIQQTV